jgi:hypothetical protein
VGERHRVNGWHSDQLVRQVDALAQQHLIVLQHDPVAVRDAASYTNTMSLGAGNADALNAAMLVIGLANVPTSAPPATNESVFDSTTSAGNAVAVGDTTPVTESDANTTAIRTTILVPCSSTLCSASA